MLAPGAPLTREYFALSVVACAALLLFGAHWLSLPRRSDDLLLYLLVTAILGYYVLVWVARWAALRRMARPLPVAAAPGLRVAVATTFVPGSEPSSMLEATLRAILELDYPHDTWVLDEGDDPEARALCERLGARHFSRRNHPRYQADSGPFATRTKHGNYNAWLTQAVYDNYDVAVTFDPDHVPGRDYLTRLLGYFRDPGVGYVQAPPVYYNQLASFIARGAAEESYAYYSSHQMASYALGHPVVVGSHSAHRVEALRAVGGFPAHDAEDLYLTMLYQALGWRGVYVPQLLALGTTPVDWPGYLQQQLRWSRALLDLKLHALPALARRLSPRERVLNLLHGAYYLRSLSIFALLTILLFLLVENRVPAFLSGSSLLAVGALLAVLHLVDRFRQRFYFDPENERGFHWRSIVLQFAKWPHLVSAFVDATLGRRKGYTITWKSHRRASDLVLTPPHLGVLLLVASAAAVGLARHGQLAPTLWGLAALVVAASLLLIWSETWRYPPPYEPGLLTERLLTLRQASRPAASPVRVEQRHAERRRAPRTLAPALQHQVERRRMERRRATHQVVTRESESALVTTDP